MRSTLLPCDTTVVGSWVPVLLGLIVSPLTLECVGVGYSGVTLVMYSVSFHLNYGQYLRWMVG